MSRPPAVAKLEIRDRWTSSLTCPLLISLFMITSPGILRAGIASVVVLIFLYSSTSLQELRKEYRKMDWAWRHSEELRRNNWILYGHLSTWQEFILKTQQRWKVTQFVLMLDIWTYCSIFRSELAILHPLVRDVVLDHIPPLPEDNTDYLTELPDYIL